MNTSPNGIWIGDEVTVKVPPMIREDTPTWRYRVAGFARNPLDGREGANLIVLRADGTELNGIPFWRELSVIGRIA